MITAQDKQEIISLIQQYSGSSLFKKDRGRVRANLMSEARVGGGNTSWNVNREGQFQGADNYTLAPFKVSYAGVLSATGASISGTITATGGSITGDLSVTGSITAGAITKQVKMDGSSGEIKFLRNGNERGSIYCDGDGLQFSAYGSDGMYFNEDSQLYVKNDLFVTDGTITAYNDIESEHGTVKAYNDVSSSHGSVWAKNDIYTKSGHIEAKTYLKAGMHIQCVNDITTSAGKVKAYNDISTSHGGVQALNDIETSNGSLYALSDSGNAGHCRVSHNIYSEDGYISAKWKIVSRDEGFQCGDKMGITGDYGYTTDDGNHYQMRFKGGILYSVRRM